MNTSIKGFHPLIKKWFTHSFSCPTDIQAQAWPLIAEKKNVLITAPTGSGKTLAAFLWFINQFATQQFGPGKTSVLYVSPLKALNNDIQRNLIQPLKEIETVFEDHKEPFPKIRVLTRSGDTPQEDRRKMVRHPPEILITTPESLNLLLSSKSGLEMLYHLSAVILDEIHAVIGNKRGVHLITAVDRLVRLSGEFQRISLSATIKELDVVSQFVGGFKMTGKGLDAGYTKRPVEVIQSQIQKNYHISVRFPEREEDPADSSVWTLLAKEFSDLAEQNRATLFFTNGRRLCEKMTYKINKLSGQPLAYSHHGSLSKQLRLNVEQNLKKGDLKAIVATSSLEMGIDIGKLEEVVLIQSPPSVSSAVQRVGRAGHHVNMESKGTLYAPHPQDLIPCAVLAKAIEEGDIEPLVPVKCPLDVLAQILISITGLEIWDIDELYSFLKTSSPYRDLTRQQYDMVLNMLAGRYSDTRIRELKPRISIDRIDNTVAARKGALLSLYTSGGTIPDRGYYQLRHHDTNARIGELDEEYVWEAKIGQVATLGTQNWKIMRITHNDVFALPAGNKGMDAPFWIAEGLNRDFHFSLKILEFLETANTLLKKPDFKTRLQKEFYLDEQAGKELIRFLERQKEHTQCDLPHRYHTLLESVRSGPDGSPGSMLVIHTLWGSRLNRPYALALEAAWENQYGEKPEIFPGNDAIVIQLPRQIDPEDILTLVSSSTVETFLKKGLENTGFFAARFRECAGRALLVTKNKINQRMPLWMTRLKSKKLLENILRFEDFPILLETWRTCLTDEFNLEQLQIMLDEIASGQITFSSAYTGRPSPFAASMAWNQINQYMYQEDQGASSSSAIDQALFDDIIFSPNVRPSIPLHLVKEFEMKCQRMAEGYAPVSTTSLLDWVKERVAIPSEEWEALVGKIKKQVPETVEQILETALPKLAYLHSEKLKRPLIVSLEWLPKLINNWYEKKNSIQIMNAEGKDIDLNQVEWINTNEENTEEAIPSASLLGQWLQFYGPRSITFIKKTLGIDSAKLDRFIDDLIESRQVISGVLIKNGMDQDICDSENFEILLRLSRADAIPVFEALDIEYLPVFLARYQNVSTPSKTIEDLFKRIEQLVCLPLPAALWESDVLPARIQPYEPSFLDTIIQEGDLQWLGYEKKKAAFCFQSDVDFLMDTLNGKVERDGALDQIFNSKKDRYDFTHLLGKVSFGSKELSERIWNQVWQTELSNETFSALRKGIENKFKPPKALQPQTTSRFGRRQDLGRKSFSQWRGSLPLAGHWFKPDIPENDLDFIEKQELNKDRARLLMNRYGILFREMLLKELGPFQWASIFRSLRLMELTGEILSGHFFSGIPGPQFISRKGFRILQSKLPEDDIYFINATDPASVCGIPLEGIKTKFPKRLSTTHLVFKGKDVMLLSMKKGKELIINASPEDENLIEYMSCLKHLLYRQIQPLKKITIETINQTPADKSPYIDAFKILFDVLVEFKKVTLYRKLDAG